MTITIPAIRESDKPVELRSSHGELLRDSRGRPRKACRTARNGPGSMSQMRMEIKIGGTWVSATADLATAVTAPWAHLAYTWDKASGAMGLYIDGVQVGSGAAPAGGSWVAQIGSMDSRYQATIDDLRIFDHAVPAGDIATWAGQAVT